jgi:hypothetical protein
MVQNAKLMAALSKGGGGGNGGGSGGGRGKGGSSNNGSRHKTPWKKNKLCPNCKKVVVHDPTECFSFEENKDKHPKGRGTKCRE